MYFRHLYATVQPTLEQRCDSWDNYCALFNVILSSNINMQVRITLQQLCTLAVSPQAWRSYDVYVIAGLSLQQVTNLHGICYACFAPSCEGMLGTRCIVLHCKCE